MCASYKKTFCFALAFGWTLTVVAGAEVSVGETSIAKWKNNYAGAISLTIDDSKIDRLDTLQILDDFDVKGTFYLDTVALQASQEMLDGFLSASRNGHEIGSHSLTHPFLTRLSEEVIDTELRESRQFLEDLTGRPVVSFAYPFGDDNESLRAKVAEYYIAARDVVPFIIHPATGQDLYRLGETKGPFGWTDDRFIDQRMQIAADTAEIGGWSIDMYHNLVVPRSRIPNTELNHSEDALRGYLEALTTSDLSLWIAPLGEVAQYYRSREGVQISIDASLEERLSVELLLADPEGRIATPLTLTTLVPEAWGPIMVRQNGESLPFSVNYEGRDQFITYNALPNGGDVVFLPIPEPTAIGLVTVALLASFTVNRRDLSQ